jgi:predicted ATPase
MQTRQEEATVEKNHVTARGGPQLPWQRLEAAAALVKHLRQRQTGSGRRRTMIVQVLRLWMGDRPWYSLRS